MASDGSNPVSLTQHPDDGYDPSWSPDGTRLAFVSDRDMTQEIYVMNADGSQQVRLTRNQAFDWAPSWSAWWWRCGGHGGGTGPGTRAAADSSEGDGSSSGLSR